MYSRDNAIKAKKSLEKIVQDLDLIKESYPILSNIEFFECSGSSKPNKHHYGDYGLIVHTEEVVRLCLANSDILNLKINKKLLTLASLYHDIGKIYDYEKNSDNIWVSSKHKRNIHHISRSAIFFNQKVDSLLDSEKDEVTHAILAHHGLREWGSPVATNSKIAWLLHLCDNISARMDDCYKPDIIK